MEKEEEKLQKELTVSEVVSDMDLVGGYSLIYYI